MNRDGAIVVIAIVALVLVAYQSGYISFKEEDTSDSVESEPVNDGETLHLHSMKFILWRRLVSTMGALLVTIT